MARTEAQQAGLDWEEKFAEAIGGELVPGSGNQWYLKLDVGGLTLLWSLKATKGDSIKLTPAILKEAVKAATGFGSPGMRPGWATEVLGERFVTLRLEDLVALFEEDAKMIRQSKASAKRARAKTPLILREDREEE